MPDKVLIVDDDVQTLRLVGLMLERQGYKIFAANSGIQALQTAHAEHPDVIVMDVMMPDMDGYEVTRRLRKDQATAHIPILMFTAKDMVDDKVSGYEAGADDYLTKPIHPAELTAHLRALLSKSKSPGTQVSDERGYTIGVIAAKGGFGVSTLALNLAIAYHQKTKSEVIAAELRPGQGTWSTELGNNLCDGLASLLRMRPADISPVTVENELVRIAYGIRLLMASFRTKDSELMQATEQLEAIVDSLPALAKLVLLDIGTSYIPGLDMLLNHCNELMVVTEPSPVSVQRTRALLDELGPKGFGRSKQITIVCINRIRADVQLSMMEMQEILGTPVSQVIPPAPELAIQAANRNVPLIQMQIGGVISQQINNLAERLISRVQE